MVKKKLISSLSAVAMAGTLFSTSVFASENNGKGSLVALGDSIPFGYNLENNNEHTSRDAFPYVIGDEATLRVRDLAIPGLKTTDLLIALETKKYQEAIQHADYVTLTIGNNDLLAAFKDKQVTPEEIGSLLTNIKNDILAIRNLTNAPIAVYNIYNPYQVSDAFNHAVGDALLPIINQQIKFLVASLGDSNIVVADAYAAFGQQQDLYVRVNDIHPTVLGQKVLAEAGLKALGLVE